MKVLLDTCVVMDFLQNREPFSVPARKIFRAAAAEWFTGCITAKAATDIYYLTHRCTHSDKESRQKLSQLLSIVGLLDTSAEDVFRAISSQTADFEDAVMVETAARAQVDCIVTRNTKDYTRSTVPVCTPDAFLERLEQNSLN